MGIDIGHRSFAFYRVDVEYIGASTSYKMSLGHNRSKSTQAALESVLCPYVVCITKYFTEQQIDGPFAVS